MSIIMALLVFTLILLIYGILSTVFTVLFRLTGLPEETARFQVVSMLTGSGYTTAESENIMGDPTRRMLARKTMLFGYVFNVTVISAIINILFSFKLSEIEEKLWTAPLPIVLILLALYLRRDARLRLWLDARVQALAGRVLAKTPGNRILITGSFGKSVMAQVHLETVPPSLRNHPLRELPMRDKGVSVVLVRRHGEEPFQATADTFLMDGDQVVVFGTINAMEDVFELEHYGEQAA